jgi:hypothetical protein
MLPQGMRTTTAIASIHAIFIFFQSPSVMSPKVINHLYKFPIPTIRDLLSKQILDKSVKVPAVVQGWVRTVRLQKKVAFAEIADGSTVSGIQAVLDPELAKS